MISINLILENACCSFGMEENISLAQVIALRGVVWNHLNCKRLRTLVNFADFIKGVPTAHYLILCFPKKMLVISW